MKFFSQSKAKVIIALSLLVVMLAGIFFIVPKTNTSFWAKNNESATVLNAGMKAEDIQYDEVKAGEDSVVDLNGEQIENLSIDAYFLEEDGTESGKQVRGAYRFINETATLHIKVNASQFLGTLSNVVINIRPKEHTSEILSISDGEFIKSSIIFAGNNVAKVELNELTGGQIVTIDVVLGQTVIWGNGQTWRENYTNINEIEVSGIYNEDNSIRRFDKKIYSTLDWDARKVLENVELTNHMQYTGNLILNSRNQVIVNLKVVSASSQATDEAINNCAEYVFEDLQVAGIKPTKVTAVSLSDGREVRDVNYDSANDKLTFRNYSKDAGNGVGKTHDYTSLITLIYPSSLYNAVKETDTAKDYKITTQHIGLGNEKFIYDGTSIISGTNETGLVYSNTKDAYCTIDFDVFEGQIFTFTETILHTNKYNTKIKYSNIDTTAGYVEHWDVGCAVGGEYVTGLLIKRNYNNQTENYAGPDTSFLTETNTIHSFEDAKYYTGIQVNEGFKSLFGNNGKIYVYDDITDELILTITDTEKHIFADECSKEKYKSIRIETSAVVNPGFGIITNFIEIDNDAIVKKFDINTFDSFTHILAGARLYAKSDNLEAVEGEETIGDYLYIMQDNDSRPYNIGEISYTATDNTAVSTFRLNEVGHEIILRVLNYQDSYASNTLWINPRILVEFPEEVRNVKIDSIVSYNGQLKVKSYKRELINGKNVLKIETEGTTDLESRIKLNLDIETNDQYISGNTQTETGKIRTFVYSEYPYVENIQGGFPAGNATDIYDWNENGLTNDDAPVYNTNLIIQSPTGIATNTRIVYTSNGVQNEVLCPDIGIITPQDGGRNAEVQMNVYNYFNKAVSKLKVIGKIPFEGNTFVNQDTRSLNSTFSTQMVSGGITIPNELNGLVEVYYSEKEVNITDSTTYMNIQDAEYGWKTASQVTEWSKIKSYVIDFQDVVLQYKDNYQFSYKVAIPSNIQYGQQTFATHAIECGINEENSLVTYSKTETNKVGLRVEPNALARLILTKMSNEGSQINGAQFKLSRPDGGAIEFSNNEDDTYITEKTITSNPNIELSNLYVDVQYKLEETKVPEGYAEAEPILFTIKTKTSGGYELVVEQGEISGNATIVTNQLITGKTDVLVTGATVVNYIENKYTVIYEPGTHGTFDIQTYPELKEGVQTPAFVGEKSSKPGYTFTGWIEEGTTKLISDADIANTTVTKDTKYVAQWEPSNTKYTVQYYYEENGSYPATANGGSVERSGITDTQVTVTENDRIPQREKYVFDTARTQELSGIVAGDGSLVLKVYFKRTYTVIYKPGTQGTFDPQTTENIIYNTDTPDFVGEKTCNPGYEFVGWDKPVADKVTEDAVYIAQWKPSTNTKYKVEFYYQENGEYKNIPNDIDNRTGTTNEVAAVTDSDKLPDSKVAPKDVTYVFDKVAPNVLSGVITGDGSLVLKVYFKEQYTINYEPGTHGTFTPQTNPEQNYGDNTPSFKGTPTGEPGYEFKGWDKEIPEKVAEDATYIAQWEPRKDTKYIVEYYYEENGKYPSTPNGGSVERTGTTDTLAQVTQDDKTPKRTNGNYVYDTQAANIEQGNIAGDGSLVLKVHFKEIPVTYDLDVTLEDTKDNVLTQNRFAITRINSKNEETILWDNIALKDGNEVEERKLTIDTYTYEIRELQAPNKNYVNILEGKYIKITAQIASNGEVSIKDWKVYKNGGGLAISTDPIYDYIQVNLETPENANRKIDVIVKNPVTFTVEVEKIDTDGEALANTGIEINSEVIDNQNAYHRDNIEKESITSITTSGTVTGTTNNQGIIKYDETWVNANENSTDFYTFKIKETKTAGEQYVNILEGYEIVVRVHVEPDGTLTLVNKNGQKYDANAKVKYAIQSVNGQEASITSDLYNYVKVEITENSVSALIDNTGKLDVEVTNPVKFNIDLITKDTKNNFLPGTKLTTIRAKNELFNGNVNNEVGSAPEILEGPISAGVYTYYITENQAAGSKYVNILDGKYIKLVLKVEGNGKVSILDANGNPNSDYFEVYTGNMNDTDKSNHSKVTDTNILKNIKVNPTSENEVYTIEVEVINPVKYQVDIITKDTLNNFLTNTKVVAYKGNEKLYDNNATNIEETNKSEVYQEPVDANNYVYYFTQTGTKEDNYVNVLEGKFIKATVAIEPNGTLKLNSVELYKGNIGDSNAELINNTEESVYDYFEVKVIPGTDIDTLQVIIINPVEFKVEVDTVDSGDAKDENGNAIKSPLGNTNIEISSPIIKEQNAEHANEKISGVTNISKEGIVNGTTTDVVDNGLKARVSYEETWVNANETETQYYEYVIKETKAAGNQYVNILDGYKVIVRVHVDADGRLTLVDANGKAYAQNEKYKFEIVSETGAEVPEDIYTYVDVTVNNGKVKATFNAQIENPVKYNVAIHETIYGKEQIPLQGMPIEVSGFSPKTIVVTGEDGSVSFEESPVRADTYKYVFTQLDEFVNAQGNTVPVEDEFVNILDDYYIGVDLRVHANGEIKSINPDGDETTTYYTLYKRDENGEFKQISFEDTIVDDFVKVKITEGQGEQDDIYTLNVYIQIPEKYNFNLVKTDIDTKENLNNVEFSIVVKDENGEVVLKDALSGKDAKDSFETIVTKSLKTQTVNDIDGIIEVNNILIEKAGTYTFTITENTPQVEGLIYKEKSEPIVVKVEIAVENGRYVVKNMELIQAQRYAIAENTLVSGNETNTINVNVLNERIKGSYDLITTTINKFNEQLLDGGIYKITVKDENGEKVLYVEDGNVLSQNPILPYEGDIEGDIEGTSILTKEDIRIDLPGTYTITIEEIKSPENFIKLDDVIEFTVTTGVSGEFDEAKYVIKEVKLKEANHGLVTLTNTEDKIDVVVRKEYFDLSLRQYITSVNGQVIKDRIPSVVLDEFNKSNTTTAKYVHKKEAQRAYVGDEIIYTIEVYNEGLVDGYAQEIVQYIPEGLEFVDDEFNKEQGWIYIGKDNKAVNTKLAKQVSEENTDETKEEENLIKAYSKDTNTISSKKIQIKLKVSDNVKVKAKLTTIAEITKVLVEDRKETLERDSKELVKLPEGTDLINYKDDQLENEYIPGNEDDDDFEKLVIEEFDLATVKYVKQVNDKVIEERIPELSLDNGRMEEYKAGMFTGFKYKPDLEIEKLQQNDTVVYGIRVYNEGTVAGYASEVKDNLPEGLVLKQDSEINKKYGWVMIDELGKETDDIEKACYVVTNYLSKEVQDAKNAENVGNVGNVENSKVDNLLLPKVVENEIITIDYRDIEIEFTVAEPTTEDRTIENIAEVSKFDDELGLQPNDIDPEEKLKENIEKIYVKVFDLELTQKINSVVVTNKNGKVIADINAKDGEYIEKFAKVDIPNTELDGSNIKVEYLITVKNNGETSGYATEIKDYMPSGFKFVQEDNKDWKESNGILTTDILANELLKPQETKTISLILTWNDSNNIGNKENIAEISADADENKLDVNDIDSTPDNKVKEEDDQDETVVIIAVRTGKVRTINVILSIACFVTAACVGIVYFRREK